MFERFSFYARLVSSGTEQPLIAGTDNTCVIFCLTLAMRRGEIVTEM
jgi:hypothetical protein